MSHIHEKIDFTVSVFVVYKNKVLLHLHDKYKIWLPVGGHIELEEDPNQAALREVKEEAGIAVALWDGNKKFHYEGGQYKHKELIAPVALNRHHTSPEHEHVDLVYFAKADTDKVIPEHSDGQWGWLGKEDLDSVDLKDLPDVRFYAELALETLKE